ncbi:hypothetical protein ACHQM5_024456 [Ranunculus cassubicifolius]
MHAKSDSEVTSIDASTPPRSPQQQQQQRGGGRPLYYVQSPSNHDVEKMSYGSSPIGSPPHYHSSPIHHSRESSSTTRFSASLKNPRNLHSSWKKIHNNQFDEDDDEDEDDEDQKPENRAKFYAFCFVLSFILLFTLFSLILWAASTAYKPKIVVTGITFIHLKAQSGYDNSGVPTEMLDLNSTVKMFYRNRATFFGVHVSATPVELYYYDFKVATGHMKEFYQSRKSEKNTTTSVTARQIPLYGAMSIGDIALNKQILQFNLTFTVRTRAYVLGKLVKPKFYRKVLCLVEFKGTKLGKTLKLRSANTLEVNSCL